MNTVRRMCITLTASVLGSSCCINIPPQEALLELPVCADQSLVLEPAETSGLSALGVPLEQFSENPRAVHRAGDKMLPVPQVPQAEVWFARSSPGAKLVDGLAVCRVSVDPGNAPNSGKELIAEVTVALGDTPAVTHSGTRGQTHQFLTIPHATLRQGEQFRVDAVQRNEDCEWLTVFIVGFPICWDKSASLGTASMQWDSGPPVVSSGGLSAECRAIPADTVSAQSARVAREVDSSFRATCDRLRVQPNQSDLGRPEPADLESLAGWLGWDDPRTAARAKRHDTLLIQWDAAIARWAGERAEATTGRASISGVSYTVGSVTCGPAAFAELTEATPDDIEGGTMMCALEMEIRNGRSESFDVGSYQLDLGPVDGVTLVTSSGQTTVVEFDSAVDGSEGHHFSPGGRHAVRLSAAVAEEPRWLVLSTWDETESAVLELP